MTLQQIIERYEASKPAPIAPHNVLTPLGDATVTLYRLKRQLATLEPAERAQVVGLIVSELGIVAWPEPLPVEQDARYCFFCGTEYPADTFDCPTCPPVA